MVVPVVCNGPHHKASDVDIGELEGGGACVAHDASPDLDQLQLQAGQRPVGSSLLWHWEARCSARRWPACRSAPQADPMSEQVTHAEATRCFVACVGRRTCPPASDYSAAAACAAVPGSFSPHVSNAAFVAAFSASVNSSSGRRTGPPTWPSSSCQYFWCA